MTFNITQYSATQKETAHQIYGFWTGVGLTSEQACGLLAQADAESSLNYKAIGDHGEAFGLHQLHLNRIELIRDGNKQYKGCGIDISKLPPVADQLKAVWHELNNSEHGSLAKIKATKTASDSGAVACKYYERPASSAEPIKRGVTAQGWYDYSHLWDNLVVRIA